VDVLIDPHTLARAEERGTNAEEIKDVIETGLMVAAKYGRAGKAKVYEFKQSRLDRYYEQKRVEVFYVKDGERIIAVTVYVFYGSW
jgi:hypothetical protein